jgi:hypothetical protein
VVLTTIEELRGQVASLISKVGELESRLQEYDGEKPSDGDKRNKIVSGGKS